MIKALCALILAFIFTACAVPPTFPITPDPVPATPPPDVVWGDSLSWQATNYPSTPDLTVQDREWHVRPGKSLRELEPEILADVHTHPNKIYLALGTNDAGTWDGRDGWTPEDEAAWYRVLSARADTEMVVVLPWVEDGLDVNALDLANVERAREWFATLPTDGITFVDWKNYVVPGTLDAGGIHVIAGQEGVRYQATVAGGSL